MKVAPRPGADSSSTLPPWASAMARTMASPRPAPSDRRPPAPRAKRSKIRSRSGFGDSRPLVGDPEPGEVLIHRGPDPDRGAVLGVLGGVGGELHDGLGKPLAVGHQPAVSTPLQAPVAGGEGGGLGHQLDGLAPLTGIVAQQLEVAPDDRDRRAQLVTRVGDEVLLAGERVLEPVEHRREVRQMRRWLKGRMQWLDRNVGRR